MLIIKQNTQQSVYFQVTRQVSQQVLKSTLAKIYQIQRRKIGTIPHGPFGVQLDSKIPIQVAQGFPVEFWREKIF